MYSPSSSQPTPQLLWQVLIVLSTCSSSIFDSSATVCISSCASSRCLNSRSPVCHLKPTSLSKSLHRCSSARAASSPHVHVVGEDCSIFQIRSVSPSDSSSAVQKSRGSMIVTFLSSATSPCKRWNRAPLLRKFFFFQKLSNTFFYQNKISIKES